MTCPDPLRIERPTKGQSVPSELRIPELDGVRGIAVLMVLVWHFIGAILSPKLGEWASLATQILILGRTGVDLFFVLSGFLIIGILVDHKGSSGFFSIFYVRRVLRIWPAYLLLFIAFWAGTIVFIRNRVFGDDIHFLFHLTFLQNWVMASTNSWGPAGFAVTWSVAIEEQFYLVFPFIVYFTPRRHLMSVLLGIGVSSCVLRLVWAIIYPEMSYMPYVATPFRLDGLCAGGIVALLWRAGKLVAGHSGQRHYLYALYILWLCVPILLIALARNRNWHMNVWGHTFLTGLYSLALINVLLCVGSSKTRALRLPLLRDLGQVSYGLYLYHPMILAFVFLPTGRLEIIDSFATAALAMLGLALSLLVCWASYHYIEEPILGFARRFKYGPAVDQAERLTTPSPRRETDTSSLVKIVGSRVRSG